jgi:3',5'-cyclic AMP phosphodiesterase CpdA
MKRHVLILLAIFTLYSCHFVYHPDEVRPNAKNLNALNLEKINSLSGKNSFKFILTGDTQRFYDEVDKFIDHVNTQNDISFVLLNGDLVDFGLNREYNWVAEKFTRLNVPYIAAIGNHDMLANGRQIFHEMFGPENFSFTFSHSKFICLNTNSRETGFDGTLPDIPFLKQELADTTPQNIFILSHVAPFSVDFDRNLEDDFRTALESNPRVHLSLHGHEHHYMVMKPYADDITFLLAGAENSRSYALVSVNGEEHTIEQKFY